MKKTGPPIPIGWPPIKKGGKSTLAISIGVIEGNRIPGGGIVSGSELIKITGEG
jgi:hypothetical protein